MSVLVFVSITPLGVGESVSSYVAKAVDVIDRSGLPYQLTPMGTIVEGKDWTEVMDVIGRAFQAVADECPRVSFIIKGDYRRGRVGGLKKKVESVERKLGRPLQTGSSTETEGSGLTP